MDLMKLYKKLPPEIGTEANLRLWLRNAYKIKEWDLASLDSYINVLYSQRLLVLNADGVMVKGPRPREMTPELQHQLALERERERLAEQDARANARVDEALEPARREFASQLQWHLGDRLARIEMSLADLHRRLDGEGSSDTSELQQQLGR